MRYVDGEVTDALLEGFGCAFRRVDPLQYRKTCAWAVWFYGSLDFPVLQLFWPDKQGRFPWDEGCHEAILRLQPDLGKPLALVVEHSSCGMLQPGYPGETLDRVGR